MAHSNGAGPALSKLKLSRVKGPLAMAALILAIELVSRYVLVVVNPIPLYLAAVAFAAFSGGARSILLTLGLMLLHALFFYSTPDSDSPFDYSDGNLWPILALAITAPVVAIVASMIRRRIELLAREETKRIEAEAAQWRAAFLAEAGAALAVSLDYETTLKSMARLALPALADACVIDLKEEDDRMRRVAVAHVSPEKEELLQEVQRRYPPDMNSNTKMSIALRSGQSELLTELTESIIAQHCRDAEHVRLIRAIGIRSMMAVPLNLRGRTLGVMGLFLTEPGRRYVQADLALAEEIARRAALAIDNARLYREAQEANRSKDEFLATVSHELRTPLNAILGWSQILLGDRVDEETRKRALETIERNARAQAQLIDDILDVSRIITGRLRLDVKPVEIVSVVSASVDSVRPAAQARAIELRMALDPSVDYVSGDPNRLQQIMWNLLSNAIKFTPSGGRVEVRLERADDLKRAGPQARITVTDTGQGIAAGFLPHVFDRFKQADSSTTRRHGGLGLGLAIVRHLVEMHGGSVSVESAGEGQGASFGVSFPLIQAQHAGSAILTERGSLRNEAATADGAKGSRDGLAGRLAGLRLLAVDDEPDTRDMLVSLFAHAGAEVRSAASAREAREVLARWKPGVIVADIGMPGEDGYELIRSIRSMKPEQGGDIPAVALTAYARADDKARALSSGFQMHVSKPVEPSEIISIVAKLAPRARGV